MAAVLVLLAATAVGATVAEAEGEDALIVTLSPDALQGAGDEKVYLRMTVTLDGEPVSGAKVDASSIGGHRNLATNGRGVAYHEGPFPMAGAHEIVAWKNAPEGVTYRGSAVLDVTRVDATAGATPEHLRGVEFRLTALHHAGWDATAADHARVTAAVEAAEANLTGALADVKGALEARLDAVDTRFDGVDAALADVRERAEDVTGTRQVRVDVAPEPAGVLPGEPASFAALVTLDGQPTDGSLTVHVDGAQADADVTRVGAGTYRLRLLQEDPLPGGEPRILVVTATVPVDEGARHGSGLATFQG